MTEAETTKPKRRWLRYSLRTLLIVVTLTCIALGWKVNQARRQRDAAQALHDKGIHVIYDYQLSHSAQPGPDWLCDWMGVDYFAHVVTVHNGGEGWYPLSNSDLACLVAFPYLEELSLVKSERLTDEGIANVAGLKQLQRIGLFDAPITDDALKHLATLEELTELSLCDLLIDGRGLTHLKQLSKLRWVVLRGTFLTNEGLSAMPALPSIKVLEIGGTQITDASLKRLCRFPNLTVLRLNAWRVTVDGLKCLQGAAKLRELRWKGLTTDKVKAADAIRSFLPQVEVLRVDYWFARRQSAPRNKTGV